MFVVDFQDPALRHANSRRGRMIGRFICALALLLGLPVGGQSPYSQFPPANHGRLGHNDPDATAPFGGEAAFDEKHLRQLNLERQKELVSDTAKLLQLARELNDQITDDSPMTDAQMRKVGEIAKLARSVKEKMTFAVGGNPGLKAPVDPRIQ
jgi:hypothetical protein